MRQRSFIADAVVNLGAHERPDPLGAQNGGALGERLLTAQNLTRFLQTENWPEPSFASDPTTHNRLDAGSGRPAIKAASRAWEPPETSGLRCAVGPTLRAHLGAAQHLYARAPLLRSAPRIPQPDTDKPLRQQRHQPARGCA